MGGRQLDHDWFPKPLPANVHVGERSWLYSSYAFVHYRSERDCGVRVGRDTGIYNGTFFDLGPAAEVSIGDYCTLVGAVISTNSRVVINDYVFIAHEVTIADSFAAMPPGANGRAGDRRSDADIVIGEGAWIGARAILLPGARIGSGAIVGAACMVDMEVPPLAVVAGNPARLIRDGGAS